MAEEAARIKAEEEERKKLEEAALLVSRRPVPASHLFADACLHMVCGSSSHLMTCSPSHDHTHLAVLRSQAAGGDEEGAPADE